MAKRTARHGASKDLFRYSGFLRVVLFSILYDPAILFVQAGSSTAPRDTPHETYALPHETCTLYLAESTIPKAGMGIFTAIDRHVDEKVGDGDMCIPLMDMNWHNDRETWFWPLDDYVWGGHVMGMEQETDSDDIEAYCPGLDCAVNCNLALINVGKADPVYDVATQLGRDRDPGVGTYSPYQNGTTLVIADIPAGGELFKFYGENWFTTRTESFGLIPLIEDHDRAEEIVYNFDQLPFPSETAKGDFWEGVVKTIPWESRTSNALPNSKEEAKLVAEYGIRALHQPNATRSREWLIEHGRCIDHLEPRPHSTLPQAARGAFTKHYLPKHTVITSSPLLTIVDRNYLNIYQWEDLDGDGTTERNGDKVIGKQLLLNYAFGHPDTTLLLAPYGAAVNYINHNQTLANVKIQWSKDGEMHHNSSWFDLTPKDMKWDYKTSLSIDFIALRDILPDEEIFLDYGNAFEAAWQVHVETWKAPVESENYAPAEVWNRDMASAMLRTYAEQELDPYPENILLRCHPSVREQDMLDYLTGEEDPWDINEKGIECGIDYRYMNDDGETLYDVSLHGEMMVQAVPRSGIRFIDATASTDLHLPNVFRHEMHFPDDMIPDAWRNIPRPETQQPGEEEPARSDDDRSEL